MQKLGTDPRETILKAAATLLRENGIDSLTTRRVADAAGTQPPTIYRYFGDKDGLLGAVADHVMTTYVKEKATKADQESISGGDALDDLRASFRQHIEFGLANPELFTFMIDPRRARTAAVADGRDVLRARVHRLAATGVLRVSEQRAVEMISAAGNGAILCTLGSTGHERSQGLGDVMLEAVLGAVLASPPSPAIYDVLQNAVTLAAITPVLPNLTEAERNLMTEWLARSIEQLQAS